jgi:hypothetical protein
MEDEKDEYDILADKVRKMPLKYQVELQCFLESDEELNSEDLPEDIKPIFEEAAFMRDKYRRFLLQLGKFDIDRLIRSYIEAMTEDRDAGNHLPESLSKAIQVVSSELQIFFASYELEKLLDELDDK